MRSIALIQLKHLSFLAVFVVALAGWLAAAHSSARVVADAPWHPVAAAYRTMMFMGDLKPVPWGKISQAYTRANPAAYGAKSARETLAETSPDLEGRATAALGHAIEMEDRQALYVAATRTLSSALRQHLDAAAASLDEPSATARHVASARDLYRALEDFIRQADPHGHRTIRRAWLAMTSATGPTGETITPANGTRFTEAGETITAYLKANFEPETFTPRTRLTPLPETVVADNKHVVIKPWLPPGSNLNDQDPLPLLVLNFRQQGIEKSDLPMIAYGDMLFDSPQIFGDPAKSLGIACSTCHNRSDVNRSLFIPGISHQAGAIDVDGEFFNSRFNDMRDDGLDIPSLRGLRFTGPYGRNGRFASLRDFTRNVIVNEFAGPEPTPFMLDALVGYMLEFDFLPNSKITGDGRLTDEASDAARRGEELFRKSFAEMQGKSCATCHVPSANFLDRQAHDIGSQTGSYANSQTAAFDTPTLLGARFNAPYFHDGSLPTLASVVEWYNLRFGLGLADGERADLTAYLEAVGDADQPYEVYEGHHTPFRLAFENLTAFASTLDMLIPDRDAFHAKLMIDTVTSNLSLDAAAMANLDAKPKVYELAQILIKVGDAIDTGDWEQARTQWQSFKTLRKQYDAVMY